jgi:SAM-dependent methyltransferase
METQLYKQMHSVEDKHWWFTARRSIIRKMLRSLDLAVPARILDVGCGTGGNLPMLSEFGEVTGMEMNKGAAAMARTRGMWPVVEGSLPDQVPTLDGQFDLILLADVLEHIDNDTASLRTLSSLLVPGGYLVLTVPAFPFLWSQHDIAHHHKRRYVSSTLRSAITAAHLRVLKLSYYNTWLFPAVAAARLIERVVPRKGYIANGMHLPSPAINRVLEGIFSSEGWFLKWGYMPFGVSLLAIAQRGCEHRTEGI